MSRAQVPDGQGLSDRDVIPIGRAVRGLVGPKDLNGESLRQVGSGDIEFNNGLSRIVRSHRVEHDDGRRESMLEEFDQERRPALRLARLPAAGGAGDGYVAIDRGDVLASNGSVSQPSVPPGCKHGQIPLSTRTHGIGDALFQGAGAPPMCAQPGREG